MNNNDVDASLTKAANHVVTKMKERLSGAEYPNEIKEAISIDSPKHTLYQSYIDILISLKTAPMAGAFEYGSGIHRERGEKAKYPIRPVNASALAFPWPDHDPPWGSPKFIGMAGEKFLFRWVDHPGIEARPYIRPTVTQEKDEVIKILGQGFRAMIMFDVPRVTVIS